MGQIKLPNGEIAYHDHTILEQNRRMECLKMAASVATIEQVQDGTVYKIAEDYYDYIINGKKLINNQ